MLKIHNVWFVVGYADVSPMTISGVTVMVPLAVTVPQPPVKVTV